MNDNKKRGLICDSPPVDAGVCVREHSLHCGAQHRMQSIGQWEVSFWERVPAQFAPDQQVHLS